MVQVAGVESAARALKRATTRLAVLVAAGVVVLVLVYSSCTARVLPNQWGLEQRKFGTHRGIAEQAYGPGLYFTAPGVTLHTFSREIHVLEASFDRQEALGKARDGRVRGHRTAQPEHRPMEPRLGGRE